MAPDLTPNNTEEADLRKTLAWMDTVLANISEGVLVLNNEWNIVFANEAIAKLAGQERTLLSGKKPWKAMKLLREGKSLEHLQHQVEELNVNTIESIKGTFDLEIGADFYKIEVVPSYIEKLQQAVVVIRDVTRERKRLEDFLDQQRKLEETLLRNEAIVESIGEGLISVNANGIIETVNRATIDTLGYRASELIGEWFPKIIKSFDDANAPIEPMDQPLVRALTEGVPVTSNLNYIKKDGQPIPVLVTASPILIDDRPAGALIVFRDFSKEREVDRMKSEFISLASHQLRTPLSAIMLYSNMLNDGYGGEITADQKTYVDTIIQTVDRMIELVSMLLNISRIESGKMMINPQPTKLEEMYKQIITELTPTMNEKKQRFTFTAEASLPQINIDRTFVKEIFSNLLSNAVKYTPESGKIDVRVWVKGGDIITEVKDNGYGIPELEQGRMFSKFYRGTNIVTHVTEGTGLGLYMVKSLAEAMNGNVWFESVENKGTTFWFSLPQAGVAKKPGLTILEQEK